MPRTASACKGQKLPDLLTAIQNQALFAGLKAALQCLPADVLVHLYGFNWHNSMWKGHKVLP